MANVEQGPFLWHAGTVAPRENPYAWTNMTNMLWVEQPVTTGFSIGKPNATREEHIAADFISWFKNWQEIFDISNYKIFVTGESFAGRYIPYISGAMLDQNDKTHFDLSGAILYEPVIGSYIYTQQEATVMPFIKDNLKAFNLNESYIEYLEKIHEECGFKEFYEKYLVYPPAGVQPPKYLNLTDGSPDLDCDMFTIALDGAWDNNNCFSKTFCNEPHICTQNNTNKEGRRSWDANK